MSVLEAMQDPAYWRPTAPYPGVEREAELSSSLDHATRVRDLARDYSAGTVALRLEQGATIPTNQVLVGYAEDHLYEGPASHPKIQQARERGSSVQDADRFDQVADDLEFNLYDFGRPTAQLLLKGLPGRWRLYERTQILAIPELDDRLKPTGQLVGMPSSEIFKPPVSTPVAQMAGNIILPKAVQVGRTFWSRGAWLSSHHRKVASAWYYQSLRRT